ncbi:S1C family serine protease [Geothrix sp. 21YS21S-4]|uniref:S1C family serine protease n=1 Tax=Geothrix sp. 21YS21S-4 TaxID=3068889 RepID=UPI0027BA9AB6|nr:trypsin-like peptidase domain-containing protein [Geothrix sp. 21YS21S-4]
MRRPLLVLGLAAGVLAGWCGHALVPNPAKPRPIESRGPLYEWEKASIQRFREAAPSVVYITTTEERSRDFFGLDVVEVPAGSGTGFIWDAEGHVVTNFHVIQGAARAYITLSDGSRHEAAFVGGAADKDLAVLLLAKTPPKLRPIPLGTSSDLQVGQGVLAIGNPFGLDQTLTTGVVSALGREIQSVTRRRITGVIQTDAAINPGNSGGPLLDSAGRLVGVNTAIQSPSGASAGIGFAVPVDTVNRVVPQLIARGRLERPDLGFEPVAPRLIERAFGPQKGVMVGKVFRGGAAARAGLQGVGAEGRRVLPGDLIQAVNGRAVEDWDGLLDAVEALPLGGTADLEIQRDGRKLRVAIRLEAARE